MYVVYTRVYVCMYDYTTTVKFYLKLTLGSFGSHAPGNASDRTAFGLSTQIRILITPELLFSFLVFSSLL